MKVQALAGKQKFDLEWEKEGIVVVNGKEMVVDLQTLESGVLSLLVEGHSYEVTVHFESGSYLVEIGGHLIPVRFVQPGKTASVPLKGEEDSPGSILSPMPGRVVGIKVTAGQEVKKGEGVILVEAMKMENELVAPRSGKVKEIKVSVGQAVEGGEELLVIG